ncbi:MAG: hypothetical protein INQ03_07440 [Candidatus Heimdallarchaeota archaeon]|nr:hypothetical protein [Candidatus Heimdallarchaeota archaeon]
MSITKINSEPISIPEVRELLLDRANEGELSYMQRLALEHAQLVSRIGSDQAKALIKNLKETFMLSNEAAITLANYVPQNIHELRQLIGKEALKMETETIEKILHELEGIKLMEMDHYIPDYDDEEDDFDQDDKELPDVIPDV